MVQGHQQDGIVECGSTLIYTFEPRLDPKLVPDMVVELLPRQQHLQYCHRAEPQHKVGGGTVKHSGHMIAGYCYPSALQLCVCQFMSVCTFP